MTLNTTNQPKEKRTLLIFAYTKQINLKLNKTMYSFDLV